MATARRALNILAFVYFVVLAGSCAAGWVLGGFAGLIVGFVAVSLTVGGLPLGVWAIWKGIGAARATRTNRT